MGSNPIGSTPHQDIVPNPAARLSIVGAGKAKPYQVRDGRFLGQAVEYAGYAGVQLFVITDGNIWQLYGRGRGRSSSRPSQLEIEFNIQSGESTDSAKKALALRQPNLDLDQTINGAPNPIFKITRSSKRSSRPSPQSFSSFPEGSPWCLVSELSVAGQQRPTCIKFPDGTEMKFVRPGWIGIPFNIARWLIATGQLCSQHLPVKLNDEVLISDTSFGPKPRTVCPGFWMNRRPSPDAPLRHAFGLLRRFDINPAKVFVNFGGSDGS